MKRYRMIDTVHGPRRVGYDEEARLTAIRAQLCPQGDCLVWTGTTTHAGYGQVSFRGEQRVVHVVLYEAAHGVIPGGLELDHTCRNRGCANLAHLEPVTHRENMLRGKTIAAAHAAKTRCVNGHEFTSENTYLGKGHRECRTCNRDRQRQLKARRRADRQSLNRIAS